MPFAQEPRARNAKAWGVPQVVLTIVAAHLSRGLPHHSAESLGFPVGPILILGGYASSSEAQPQEDFEGIGPERQSLSALFGGEAGAEVDHHLNLTFVHQLTQSILSTLLSDATDLESLFCDLFAPALSPQPGRHLRLIF